MFSALQARGIQDAIAHRKAYRFYIKETKRANRYVEWAIHRGWSKIQITMYPNDVLQADMIDRIASELQDLGYHTQVIPEADGSYKLRVQWRRR